MSHDPRYTQATRELVSAAIASAGRCDHPGAESCDPWWHADAALTALADADLLVTPSTSDSPRTWSVPEEPGPEVTAVWDALGDRWVRMDGGWQMDGHEVCCASYVKDWADLRFPLADATAEVPS